MKKNSGDVVWRSLLLKSLVVGGILLFQCDRAFSQVTPDNTLGDESSVVNTRDETSDSIDGGAVRGQNLFHSFQEFNVDAGRGVYFANPEAVNNIFSRVTGNNVSNILGTLGVDGAANLFLINPNGIVFGEAASLDVQGSFAATTANGIEFGEQGFFSASNPETPQLLTINPSAYLFNQVAPGAIALNSRAADSTGSFAEGLSVPVGKNLSLIGGDITLNNGLITAPGATIELGGLNAAGIIEISDDNNLVFPKNITRADVFITNNSFIAVSLAEGGDINVNARNLELSNSFLLAGLSQDLASSEAQAADIKLNATEKTKIEGNLPGLLTTTINNNGGNITITTGSLAGVGNFNLNSLSFGDADSGNIIITANEQVSLLGTTDNTTFISSFADLSATGNSGNIFIATPSLSLFNITIGAGSYGLGNAGNIQIYTTDSISLNNSLITTSSLGEGSAGNITIESEKGNISFDATKVGAFAVSALGFSGNSASGDIIIRGQSLLFANDTNLSADNDGTRNAGNISLEAAKDTTITSRSLISSSTGGRGNAGNLGIKTKSLLIEDASLITTSTFGEGKAGNVSINASDSVIFDGLSSGAISSVNPNAEGEAGKIFINTNDLKLIDNAILSASTNGNGEGGEIKLNTNRILLEENSLVATVSTTDKKAGNIIIYSNDAIEVQNSYITSSSSKSTGGEIQINAEDIRLRSNSDILTNVNSGADNGGDITLTANSIIAFDDSDIFAFAANGQGGNINLNTPAYFAENFTLNSLISNPETLDNNSRADLNATGTISGNVTIPDVSFIQNSLSELPNNSLNTDELVANSCVVPVGDREQGKFIITGTESLPLSPGDGIPSKYPTGEVRSVPEHSSWHSGDPIVEPQDAYRLANGKLVLSRECSR